MQYLWQQYLTSIITIFFLHLCFLAVGVVRAATMPPGIIDQAVRCFTNLRCDPNDPGMTFITTSQCCLSERGLTYNPTGTEDCIECVCK